MRNLLILGTFGITLSLLIAGIWYPNSELMWLASSDALVNALRGVTLLALFSLIVTTPPRSLVMRAFLLGLSASIMLFTVGMLYSFELQIVDAIVATIVAIILAIEGVEYDAEVSAADNFYAHR